MNKVYKIFAIIFLMIISNSCEDGFEPKAEFEEEYVLFSIINADTNYQTAILSKSFNVDGFNPLENTNDPDIKNAVVKIYKNGIEHLLKDTSAIREYDSRYNQEQFFFYTNNLSVKEGDELTIEAILPNGDKISSETIVPKYSLFVFDKGDRNFPIENEEKTFFSWLLRNTQADLVYKPRYIIKYVDVTDATKFLYKEVPLKFIVNNGRNVPIYPRASGNTVAFYDTIAVHETLNLIEPDTTRRKDITIIDGEFEVSIFDENLGSYVTTIENIEDGFTIRTFEGNFSNIDNGIGIFGAVFTKRKPIIFNKLFLRSIGYSTN